MSDWNPADHPRGPGGRFADSFVGRLSDEIRSSDLSKLREQTGDGFHGDMPLEPLPVAVVGMKVRQGGQWHVLDVPPNLTTVTHD